MTQPNPGYLPLKETIKHKGKTLTQIKRSKRAAMYQVTNCGIEVIKIRLAEECKIGDNVIEAREIYPSDEQFGTFGWYYMKGDEDRATKKWREIK